MRKYAQVKARESRPCAGASDRNSQPKRFVGCSDIILTLSFAVSVIFLTFSKYLSPKINLQITHPLHNVYMCIFAWWCSDWLLGKKKICCLQSNFSPSHQKSSCTLRFQHSLLFLLRRVFRKKHGSIDVKYMRKIRNRLFFLAAWQNVFEILVFNQRLNTKNVS